MRKRGFRIVEGGRRWTKPTAYGHEPERRKASWLRFLPLWLGAILIGLVGAFAWNAYDRSDPAQAATLMAAAGERVTFGLCEWGGGTDCVVDGDTIYLHHVKIRIAGIDAPETHEFKCPAEKALGDRATRRLRQLVNSGGVSLSSIDRDEDVYGRKLRNVAVNGRDVGDVLVSEGLARPYRGFKMGWC